MYFLSEVITSSGKWLSSRAESRSSAVSYGPEAELILRSVGFRGPREDDN